MCGQLRNSGTSENCYHVQYDLRSQLPLCPSKGYVLCRAHCEHAEFWSWPPAHLTAMSQDSGWMQVWSSGFGVRVTSALVFFLPSFSPVSTAAPWWLWPEESVGPLLQSGKIMIKMRKWGRKAKKHDLTMHLVLCYINHTWQSFTSQKLSHFV